MEAERPVPSSATDVVFAEHVGPPGTVRPDFERPSVPRPLFLVSAFYAGGLTLGRTFQFPPGWLFITAILALLSGGLFLLGTRRDTPVFESAGLFLLLSIALLGWDRSNQTLRADREAAILSEKIMGSPIVRVSGRVRGVEAWGSTGVRLRVSEARMEPAGERYERLNSPMDIELIVADPPSPGWVSETSEVRWLDARRNFQGSQIEVWAVPKLPDRVSNPWSFDSQAYQRSRGIACAFRVRSFEQVRVTAQPPELVRYLHTTLVDVQAFVRSALIRHLPSEAAALAGATTLGDRSLLSPETKTRFRESGLTHVLVVSGLHTGFVLLLVMGLARATGLPPWGWVVTGLLALGCFVILVGFRPPVIRASIMGAFLLLAWALGRPQSTLAALAASAFITLLIDPRNLIRIDWQLSYACVLSLAVFAHPMMSLSKHMLGIGEEGTSGDGRAGFLSYMGFRWIVSPVIMVAAILMGLLPLQFIYFGQINAGVMFSNLLAIPLVQILMLCSYLLVLFEWIPFASLVLGSGVNLASVGLVRIVEEFSIADWTRIHLSSIHPLFIIGYLLIALTGPHLRSGSAIAGELNLIQRRHLGARIILFLLLMAWTPVVQGAGRSRLLQLYMVDVGQGEALVIRMPNGVTGIVDGGRGYQARRSLVPLVKGLGIERVAFVAATHADADHVGGLDEVVDAFDVRLFLWGRHQADTVAWNELVATIGEERVMSKRVLPGDQLAGLGEVRIQFLGPLEGQTGNNASLVMLLEFGDIEILLTGDIEREAEHQIVQRGLALDIDVLKIAHHGSSTSSSEAFLEGFAPEVALISAGRGNRFNHPSPQILERLRERGMTIARTDLHGTILLESDGRRIRLSSYRSTEPGHGRQTVR